MKSRIFGTYASRTTFFTANRTARFQQASASTQRPVEEITAREALPVLGAVVGSTAAFSYTVGKMFSDHMAAMRVIEDPNAFNKLMEGVEKADRENSNRPS